MNIATQGDAKAVANATLGRRTYNKCITGILQEKGLSRGDMVDKGGWKARLGEAFGRN